MEQRSCPTKTSGPARIFQKTSGRLGFLASDIADDIRMVEQGHRRTTEQTSHFDTCVGADTNGLR